MAENEKSDKTIIVNLKAEPEKPTQKEPFLVSISGRETGKAIPLKGKDFKVGREVGCDLMLDNPHISRFHAEIFWKGSQLFIKDLGSTNGVFVNGRKIAEEPLHNGDKVLFGTQMYFRLVYQDAVDQNYQQSLFKAANTDSLTQLYNKRYFIDFLEKEFSYTRRTQQPLSLIMMDIDFFKKINDTYGHVAGDKVLKSLGAILSKQTRLENISCRFGGEEFAVILRGASHSQARFVADRIRDLIAAEKVTSKNQAISFTVSMGIATFTGKNFGTSEEFIQRADELLYEAKQQGRNRTISEAA